MSSASKTTVRSPDSDAPRSRGDAGRLVLVAIGDDVLARVPLPERGAVTIGRGADAEARLDVPAISRRHARLHLGDGGALAIEDLGSANGTRVRGAAVPAGERAAIALGEVVELGSLLVTVHRLAAAAAPDAPEKPGPAATAAAAAAIHSPRLPRTGAMAELHQLVERVAPSTISVLVLGETGVGKEVLAEALHRTSRRADRPFVKLNASALSESLLESELFGHERGAFTGAVAAKLGLLETAAGGTVFLDEIGELPMSIQVKLLRVIEERAVLRVGGLEPTPIDVRFITATHRDLEAEIEAGRFRQDLYFRLDGITLRIPPLRERTGEIAGLARGFVISAWAKLERTSERPPRISPEALALLEAYRWPGNIRELRNVIERATLLSTNGVIDAAHLPVERMRAAPALGAAASPGGPATSLVDSTRREVEAHEKRRIVDALAACNGNQTQAAKRLGISRATLVTRLVLYGIPRPRKPAG